MALAYTVLTQGSDSTASSSFTTASFTPSPDSLLLLIVGYTGSGAQPLPVVTSSADSATWDDLQTAAAARSISVFRRSTTSSPPSVQATITHPTAATYTSCIWAVIQITGADLSGADNGLSAIAQTAIDNGNSTSSSVTLASPPASDSATMYAQIHPTTEAVTPRTGWTEMVEIQETGPTSTVEGQIRLSGGEQTASATWTTSGPWRGIIVEIAAAAGGGGTDGTVTGVTATATATGRTPSVTAGALVTAATPTASSLVVPPVVAAGATVTAVTATATALAAPPVLTSGSTITPAVATATAEALAPTVDPGSAPGGVVAPVATATATAVVPEVAGGAVTASVAATSTALALPPTVTVGSAVVDGSVAAVAAQATATAPAPTFAAEATVLHLRARAIAAAPAPVVAGEQNATVEVPRIFMQAHCHRPTVEVTDPTFRFECPTHEAPMWSRERIHQFYRITHAASVVRVAGSLTVVHQPRADQIAAAGEEGVDYFLGGRIYQVSLATRTELLAAGFDVE